MNKLSALLLVLTTSINFSLFPYQAFAQSYDSDRLEKKATQEFLGNEHNNEIKSTCEMSTEDIGHIIPTSYNLIKLVEKLDAKLNKYKVCTFQFYCDDKFVKIDGIWYWYISDQYDLKTNRVYKIVGEKSPLLSDNESAAIKPIIAQQVENYRTWVRSRLER